MIISAIAAMSENRVIGVNNILPWSIPEDLKFFRNKSIGKILIVGRKTLESMGGPLPSRKHIVLTRSPDTLAQYPSVYTASNVEDALIKARQVLAENYGLEPEILIGGGAEIYQAFLPHTQKIYLTLIHKKFDGDAFFPEFSNQEFKLTHQLDRQEPIPYSFCTYERI